MPRNEDDFSKLPPETRLGDAPIEAQFHELMTQVVHGLDEIFNPGLRGDARTVGFAILVFPYGDSSGRCNYASNGANREDMAKLLREQATNFENSIKQGNEVKS